MAGPCADAVDRDGRFPSETVAELRAAGLLAALVPTSLGGPGASVEEFSKATCALAQSCGSSGLILAMHGIQVASLIRHATTPALDAVLPRILAGEMLLANANSEVGLNGERRSSVCALEPTAAGFRLEKSASAVSYGEAADGVLATARRTPDSPANDQVLAVCLTPDMTLTPTGDWDTLGMRGTCSRPFQLSAEVPGELIIADYGEVFEQTALPVSAILLSSVWLGLAEAAARRAHTSVRAQARRHRAQSPGAPPATAALRLAEMAVLLHQLREVVAGGARVYERVKDSPEVASWRFSGQMNNVKLAASSLVGQIVAAALFITGIAGYANDSEVSIGRLSRDAASAPLMVNNDRALMAAAQSLLVRKEL